MAIVGLLVGPIFGLANPKEALGPEAFSSIVSLAVAIILFEGSSNLDFRELKGISKAVIRIITIGAGIAWILGAIALHITMSFPLSISFVIGVYFNHWSNCDSTFIKASESKRNVDSVLRWESIILDPIGPIIALTAFYVFQIFEGRDRLCRYYSLYLETLSCNFNRFWCSLSI